jgi:hypothetical protein
MIGKRREIGTRSDSGPTLGEKRVASLADKTKLVEIAEEG